METERDRVRLRQSHRETECETDRQTDRYRHRHRQTDKWNNVFHGIPMAYVLKVGGWRGGGVGGGVIMIMSWSVF